MSPQMLAVPKVVTPVQRDLELRKTSVHLTEVRIVVHPLSSFRVAEFDSPTQCAAGCTDMPQAGCTAAGHHGLMKSQERRDAETVTIFAGLMLFVLATALGAVVLVLVHQVVITLKGNLLNVLVFGVLAGAAVVSVRYTYRNQGRR